MLLLNIIQSVKRFSIGKPLVVNAGTGRMNDALARSLMLIVFLLLILMRLATAQNITVSSKASPAAFELTSGKVAVYTDKADAKVVSIAATAFVADMKAVSGRQLPAKTGGIFSSEYAVLIGTIGKTALLDELIKKGILNVDSIRNKWESFRIVVINQSFKGAKKILVIAGSDRRGTAFGVFQVSRLMGLSPFTWWADVLPAPMKNIFIEGNYTSVVPSVKYRGIFINDEDWGMQPWAAMNMDTAVKDIGPHTYAKVFELLLRLKANFIWPAMHPCTKAFYYYRQNPGTADDYAIVVGGSHCEPMLRNNVFEWAENFEKEYGKKPGEWRYDLNKEEMYKYWDDRVKESVHYESVYTVGMRGIHDGSMPGPKDAGEKLKLLENVITDQRKMLQQDFNKSPAAVPQIFVPYKEVLNLYNRGMQLPGDVTIIWPDDNYGYIRRLPNETERKRQGAHGVYYHLSYWGSPHDYLWLGSASPALIAYEMNNAFRYGANRLWVFNVGDIKPAELELQFSMDMAWDIKKYPSAKALNYIDAWAEETFGKENAAAIAAIKKEYYLLSNAGKPEHMDAVQFTDPGSLQRLQRYQLLKSTAIQLQKNIPDRLQDAYYELILYPVMGAALMNEKILQAGRSIQLSAAQNADAINYQVKARAAFDSIKLVTAVYNNTIANGKWNGMMSWHPRDQKVFELPEPAAAGTFKKPDSAKGLPVPVLTLNAADYTAKYSTPGYDILHLPGLGINGMGVTFVNKDPSFLGNITEQDTLWFAYNVSLQPGRYTIVVKCLPGFDTENGRQLRYALTINEDRQYLVNLHADAESNTWKQNVTRGYAAGSTELTLNSGQNMLRIYFKDNGLVINSIEFYKAD